MGTENINANKTKFEIIEHKTILKDAELKRVPKMKTIREMAELTGLSYAYLRSLCLQNKIIHIRTGKKYLINYDKFIDYLNTAMQA